MSCLAQAPETVTAGQLRRIGFYVREDVENDDTVRRSAVTLDPSEDFDDGSATLGLLLLEPFRQRTLVGAGR